MISWVWLEERDARAIHDLTLVQHGGAAGVRDDGLLQSALARPRQKLAYDTNAGLVELAAAYTFGVLRNHPFIDGNKRTGFVLGVLFLELNGRRFTATEVDATRAVLSLADGALDEPGYAAFLRANIQIEPR